MKKLDIGATHKALDQLKEMVNVVGHLQRHDNPNVIPEEPPGIALPPTNVINTDSSSDWIKEGQAGINIPWLDYGNDFVSYPAWNKMSYAKAGKEKIYKLRELFSVTRESGFGIVRFWMMPNFWHNGGKYDTAMIDEAVQSLKLVMVKAEMAGVKVIPTITSFNAFESDKAQHGTILPLAHKSHTALLEYMMQALNEHAASVEYVDIINEPEWAMLQATKEEAKPGAIDNTKMTGIMMELSRIVKRNAPTLKVGIGAASLKWWGYLPITKMDVLDFHQYDWSIQHFSPKGVLEEVIDEWRSQGKMNQSPECYVGETYQPASNWKGHFLPDYKSVLYWLEPKSYLSHTVLEEKLKVIKDGVEFADDSEL